MTKNKVTREEWKRKFEEWWLEYTSKGIKNTKSNPNGVAIGCNLDPNDNRTCQSNILRNRRYVE